ncbi:MAG: 16S rRNA (adenine(1518)-N(6)/adenine(1519)-N(6))-dimethyltransferase RsmA [Flavobacteriales bacterium]|nr:16S rRNA (adenine(1518)-N(6)/adenine(1519)-N(6))-dimethyltransferase RsmA [Flavobacteriales bacterium]
MMSVKAKKHLGQHFLKDESVSQRIADTLSFQGYKKVLEIGPGMGVLTKYLLEKEGETHVIEIDTESVDYLRAHYLKLSDRIISEDFLEFNVKKYFGGEPFAIVGNFPYNISTQIVFRLLENKEQVPEFSGMFQKEVAQRICEKKGTKAYGILSVLVQAFYDTEYLFTVPPEVFNPPPKVDSGVLMLKRKADYSIPCDEKLFFRVVKAAFNLRRKTLRNSLKVIPLPEQLKEDPVLGLRPEQMDVSDFIALTQKIESYG